MSKKDQYLVISNVEADLNLSIADAVRASMAVCTTFKMAYGLALTLGRVSKPTWSYRKCLEIMKVEKTVNVHQTGESSDEPRVSIFLIKSY